MTIDGNIKAEFGIKFIQSQAPTVGDDLTNKAYVDQFIAESISSQDTDNRVVCSNGSGSEIELFTDNITRLLITNTTTAFGHDISTAVDQTVSAPADQNYVTKKYADANYSGGGSSVGYMTIDFPS